MYTWYLFYIDGNDEANSTWNYYRKKNYTKTFAQHSQELKTRECIGEKEYQKMKAKVKKCGRTK